MQNNRGWLFKFFRDNNLKYYNGPNIHLVENVKSYRGKVSGFNFQAGLIIEQIRQKKTYIEIPIDPYLRTSGTSKSLTSGPNRSCP